MKNSVPTNDRMAGEDVYTIERIKLPRELRARIVEHAQREAPKECCGLLVARGDTIVDCVPARNVDPAPERRYEVDPADHVALMKHLRGTGNDIVGSYHSHPRGPVLPSPSDVAEAGHEGFVWIIVSLDRPDAPEVGAFTYLDGAVRTLAIVDI